MTFCPVPRAGRERCVGPMAYRDHTHPRRRTMTIVRVGAAGAALLAVILMLPVLTLGMAPASPASSSPQPFPDVELTTHDGIGVHFYDLIKGKTVAIELMYTTCQFACP